MLPRLRLRMHLLALAATGLLVAACGAAPLTQTLTPHSSTVPSPGTTLPSSAPTSAPGATGGTPQATSQPPGQGTAEIELIITGGSHAGSYRAVAPNACASDVAENRFVVAYGNDTAADGFVALQLIVRDAALADQDKTDDFGLTMGLDGPGWGTTYTIDPRGSQGRGSVQIELMPTDATVDLAAKASDGSTVELSIVCSALEGG